MYLEKPKGLIIWNGLNIRYLLLFFYYNFSKEQYGPGAPASELKKTLCVFQKQTLCPPL